MNNEQIQEALSDRNLAEVARRLSVTRSYLQAIRSGKVGISGYMREALVAYLEGKDDKELKTSKN